MILHFDRNGDIRPPASSLSQESPSPAPLASLVAGGRGEGRQTRASLDAMARIQRRTARQLRRLL